MNTNLAPIVLFVYNRPDYTRKCLQSLMANELADESELIIYADGPKEQVTIKQLQKIKEVRTLIREKKWCREVEIVERDKNLGLANSIITGVTEIIKKYGKIIVLEDDVLTSVGFLKYMNEALNLYANEEKVMHIAAHIFETKINLPETFFYNETSCWGWGTWSRSWRYLNVDQEYLLQNIKQHPRFSAFDLGRGFIEQLNANVNGTINTWAIKWNTSVFLNNGLSLHPKASLTKNIGYGKSATHTVKIDGRTINQKVVDHINVKKINLMENKLIYLALEEYFSNRSNPQFIHRIKKIIKVLYKYYSDWKMQSPSTRNLSLLIYQIKTKGWIGYFFKSNYDKNFYKEHEKLRIAYEEIAKIILKFINAESVIDFGCGNAYIISYLKQQNIQILGLDGSHAVLSIVDKDIIDRIKIVDFRHSHDFGKFDLVISMEVAEHINNKYAKTFIQNLTKHSNKYIVFSSAQPGQWGDGHINCRPKEYWINIFENYGFHYDENATKNFIFQINDNEIIVNKLPWILNNFILLKKTEFTYFN